MQDNVELILLCLLNFFPLLNLQLVLVNYLFCPVNVTGNVLKLYLLDDEIGHQPGVAALKTLVGEKEAEVVHLLSFSFTIFRASRFEIFDTSRK